MNWATIRPLIIIAVAVWGLFSFLGSVTKSSGDYSVAEAACERLASHQFAYVSQRE